MGEKGLLRAAGAGLVALFGLQFFAVYAVGFLLTNDGPQHLLMAFVHRFYHSSPLRFDETWFLSETLTAHGYREVFGLIVDVVPWQLADRIANHVPVLVGAVGWLAVARWHGGAWQVRGLFLVGLSVTWHYWIGLLPFAWAMCLTPWVLWLWWASSLRSAVAVAACAALLVVQVMCHPFPAALVGLVMVLLATGRRDGPLVLRTCVAGIPSACWTLTITSATDHDDVGDLWGQGMGVLETFKCYLPGPDLVALGLMVFLAAVVAWSARRAGDSRGARSREVAFLCGLGLVLTPLLPRTVGGWDLVGPRTLPILASLLVALAADPPPRVMRAVAAVGFVASASYLVMVGAMHREVERTWGPTFDVALRTMPTLSGLDWEFQIVDAPPLRDLGIPQFGPSLHMPQALAVERGGRPVYTQAEDATIHAILRPPRSHEHLGQVDVNLLGSWQRFWNGGDDLERRAVDLAGHFAHMTRHDILFVVGRPSDVDGLRRAGYVDIKALGKIDDALVLFQATPGPGCSATIHVDAPVADVIEIGLVPRVTPVDAVSVGAGASTVRVEGLPCGRWWLRTEQPIGERGAPHMAVDVSSDVVLDLRQRLPAQ